MSYTTKPLSDRDFGQAIQSAYNQVDASVTTNGFLVGKVGHKIEMSITTTTVANDTEVYAFSDSGTALYTITVVYTDGTRNTMISAERTA